jgi:4-amino-4-deoxy-L-arabinose transferase-like glycosyltransferase
MQFWNWLLKEKPWKILLFVATGIFILRLPTLFVEYYDIDVLTSFIAAKSKMAGLPFAYNKGPVYHWILNTFYVLFGQNPASFHFAGILIIILTSFFIYLLGKEVYSRRAGLIGAMLYGFFISAFNRQFMAVNGEIVYNLFFMASFYFFYRWHFKKQPLNVFPLAGTLLLGIFTKFQGLWALLALVFFYVIARPLYVWENRKTKLRYFILLFSTAVFLTALLIIDWNITHFVMKEGLKAKLIGFYSYVAVRGFDPVFFLGKLGHRLGMMIVFHFLLWIWGIKGIIRFFKERPKNSGELYIVALTLFLFFIIFLAGQRLYFHYFVQVYPLLSLIAGFQLTKDFETKEKTKKTAFKLLLFPLIFFFIWNVKDAYITNYKPSWFYNEGKFLSGFRYYVIGQNNDYLLPHPSYTEALKFLKERTQGNERIFVWPEGAEFVYFADLPPATTHFWYNVGALRCLKEVGRFADSKNTCGEDIAGLLKSAKPDFFIDLSLSPRSDLHKWGGITAMPALDFYVKENFTLEGEFGNAPIKIWKTHYQE